MSPLMEEVQRNVDRLFPLLREAADQHKESAPFNDKVATLLGVLTFPAVPLSDGVTIPETTVGVYYVRNWGFMYTRSPGGRLHPNNNGGLMDLLRNSEPHGLPTDGTTFTPVGEDAGALQGFPPEVTR